MVQKVQLIHIYELRQHLPFYNINKVELRHTFFMETRVGPINTRRIYFKVKLSRFGSELKKTEQGPDPSL